MTAKMKYPIIDSKKECGDCGKILPVSEFKPARNHLTSRCLSCLKAYAAAYRQRPEVRQRAKKYHQDYIKDPIKRAKKNAYKREWSKQPEARKAHNARRRKWALNQKLLSLEYKGGQCVS